jgi:hypothetical protein
MLFKTTVTAWRGIGRDSRVINKALGTEYVLDVNNVSSLKALGTGSEFLYQVNPSDRKTGYEKIECTTPHNIVREEFNIAPFSKVLQLSVFPFDNPQQTPFIIYIDVYDFSYAWAHITNPDISWLVYCQKGGKVKRVLVDMTLDELLGVDNIFDENNVQWFWFVDPLEEIVPTKFIRVA